MIELLVLGALAYLIAGGASGGSANMVAGVRYRYRGHTVPALTGPDARAFLESLQKNADATELNVNNDGAFVFLKVATATKVVQFGDTGERFRSTYQPHAYAIYLDQLEPA